MYRNAYFSNASGIWAHCVSLKVSWNSILLAFCDLRAPEAISFFFLIEVWLIYNTVLVSGIQRSDLAVCVCTSFFGFFSIIAYYKILNIIPCAIY